MTKTQNTKERGAKRISKWALVGLGIVWWVLVMLVSFLCAMVIGISAGGVVGDPELAQWYSNMSIISLAWGLALAFAPWVIGGIVFGVRWWRSRAPALPQATE